MVSNRKEKTLIITNIDGVGQITKQTASSLWKFSGKNVLFNLCNLAESTSNNERILFSILSVYNVSRCIFQTQVIFNQNLLIKIFNIN
jgi:hypothetical protein